VNVKSGLTNDVQWTDTPPEMHRRPVERRKHAGRV
jgi:hypothetical protein